MTPSDQLVECGYCHEMIAPRDPYHVHGHNECLCGVKPRHNMYLHDVGRPATSASEAHSRGLPVLGAAGAFEARSPLSVDPFERAVADEQFMERVARSMPEFKREHDREMTFRERQLGRAILIAVRAESAPVDQGRSDEGIHRAGWEHALEPSNGVDPPTSASEAHSRGLPVLGAAGAFDGDQRPRLWDKPLWCIRVLRDMAATIEASHENAATNGLDKYSRGANMQKRENLKYAADFIEHLTKVEK